MATSALPELITSGRESGDPKVSRLKEYYERMGSWCDNAHEEAIASLNDVPELNEMATAIDYLGGLQWKETMPSYRAKPVSNEMLAMFWESIGLLTDIKPMFHVKHIASDDGEFSKVQKILNTLAKGWAQSSNFEQTMAFCTMFGMFTSAPAKLYWNPFARGTSGDPSDGDISMEYLPIKSLLRLGIDDNSDLQRDECVIYCRVRTLDWIKRAYPRMGLLVEAEEAQSKYTVNMKAPPTVMPELFARLGAPAQRLMGGNNRRDIQSVYPRAEVREFWKNDDDTNLTDRKIWMGPKEAAWGYWVMPGQKLYPRGRLIIRANGVTLYDEPNPYFHRKKPFALLGLYGVPWQQYAMSVLSPWMKQQDVLNQILAGVIQVVKKAINPALMASKTSIHPEAMRAIDSSKPNLKVTYSAMGQPPVWQQPPNLPGYVLQTYGTVLTSMKQSSGAQAVGDAAGKKQVPGGDTLDKITFAKNTPIRFMGRNIETFADEIGTMWVGDAIQFYTAERRAELLGGKGLTKEDIEGVPGSMVPEGIQSEAYVQRWSMNCDKGTLLNVQRQDKIQVSFALRKNHDLSRKKLFEQLDWNINQQENDEELAKEAEMQAKAMAAAGIKPKGAK
jgi:hypothetical protein